MISKGHEADDCLVEGAREREHGTSNCQDRGLRQER